MSKLTVKLIESISTPQVITDGQGLQLKVQRNKSGELSKRWEFRYSFLGERSLMGLGTYSKSNSLKVARDKALELNGLIAKGIHPKQAKDAEKNKFKEERAEQRRQEQARANTFEHVAWEWWHATKSQWRNSKHVQQNISTLKTYVFPIVGDMPIQDIINADVLKCLKPIWEGKTDTASKIRQRMERVFNYAKVKGLRGGENPAQWKNNLEMLLPSPEKLKKNRALLDPHGGNHPSMPYNEVQDFIVDLKERIASGNSVASSALYLCVLTGVRTYPVAKARWDEIDWERSMWKIPGKNQKGGKPFNVPLSAEALQLLKSLEALKVSEYIFPSPRDLNQPIHEGTILPFLKRKMDYSDYTVHGFRATFRTWVAEQTEYDRSLGEYALSHEVGTKVEQAYQRSSLVSKRAKMMEDWADFLTKQK